jgi:hypothetical protein
MAVDPTKVKVGDYLAVIGADRQEKHVATKVKGGVITTKSFIGERLGDYDLPLQPGSWPLAAAFH